MWLWRAYRSLTKMHYFWSKFASFNVEIHPFMHFTTPAWQLKTFWISYFGKLFESIYIHRNDDDGLEHAFFYRTLSFENVNQENSRLSRRNWHSFLIHFHQLIRCRWRYLCLTKPMNIVLIIPRSIVSLVKFLLCFAWMNKKVYTPKPAVVLLNIMPHCHTP